MSSISKRESQEFLSVLANIKDERTRYFFYMLGDAIAAAETPLFNQPAAQPPQAE